MGDLGLTASQYAKYIELVQLLAQNPEPEDTSHYNEDNSRRLVRWLKAMDFDSQKTVVKLHEHAKWWQDYRMDQFQPEDELDHTGVLFACGHDREGRPTVIARPSHHFSSGRQESIQTARRCVYTIHLCLKRMLADAESLLVIFDARSLSRKNLDLTFAREVADAFGNHFPGRVSRIIVINFHWAMNFFWLGIQPVLDPSVKARIAVCKGDELAKFLPEDHPYLPVAFDGRPFSCTRSTEPAQRVKKTTIEDSIEEQQWKDTESICEVPSDWSRQSTVATEADRSNSAPTEVLPSGHTLGMELLSSPGRSQEIEYGNIMRQSWWCAPPCN